MIISGGSITVPNGVEPSGGGIGVINFANYFNGVLQSVQTDLGLTYGGTMLVTGTFTVSTTLTGTLAGVPVPILVTAAGGTVIGGGATFNISYDGGSTNAMTGVAPAAATPYPLTGAGAGLSITWAAGSITPDYGATATCSALADQSGNGWDYAQVSTTLQPQLAVGVNGFAYLSFDGVNDNIYSSLLLPAPGTTPTCLLAVYSPGAYTSGFATHFDAQSTGTNAQQISVNTTGVLISNSGTSVSIAYTADQLLRLRADWANSASDILRIGSSQVTGNAGNASVAAGRIIGAALSGGTRPGKLRLLSALYLSHIPSAGEMATFDAAVTAKYGASVLV